MILDPMDPAWVADKYFTSAQMEIIRNDKAPELPELPAELWKYLVSYIGKVQLLYNIQTSRLSCVDIVSVLLLARPRRSTLPSAGVKLPST